MLHHLESLYDSAPWDLLQQYSIKRPADQIAKLNARLPEAFIEGCIEWPLTTADDGIDMGNYSIRRRRTCNVRSVPPWQKT